MNVFELVVASALALLGLRSLAVWGRRPVEWRSARDVILYALFLTGRVGVWFALAGLFYGYAFVKDDQSIRWLVLVPIVLAAVSTLSAYALGRGD